jgi:hypothetical protein
LSFFEATGVNWKKVKISIFSTFGFWQVVEKKDLTKKIA